MAGVAPLPLAAAPLAGSGAVLAAPGAGPGADFGADPPTPAELGAGAGAVVRMAVVKVGVAGLGSMPKGEVGVLPGVLGELGPEPNLPTMQGSVRTNLSPAVEL